MINSKLANIHFKYLLSGICTLVLLVMSSSAFSMSCHNAYVNGVGVNNLQQLEIAFENPADGKVGALHRICALNRTMGDVDSKACAAILAQALLAKSEMKTVTYQAQPTVNDKYTCYGEEVHTNSKIVRFTFQ